MSTSTDGRVPALDRESQPATIVARAECGKLFKSLFWTFDEEGNSTYPRPHRTVLTTTLSPGSYWVVMDGFSSSRGFYRLALSCPSSIVAPGTVNCGQTVTGNTGSGTNTVGHSAPEHWYALRHRDSEANFRVHTILLSRWRFAAPSTGAYRFNSCGSKCFLWSPREARTQSHLFRMYCMYNYQAATTLGT